MKRRGFLLALAAAPPKGDLLVYDIQQARWLEQSWHGPLDEPQPAGSLLKPFLALAAPPPYPRFLCEGGCWLNRRHGIVTLPQALAQSCNRWFDQWLAQLPATNIEQALSRFALPTTTAASWKDWRCPPQRFLLAWADLAARRNDPALTHVLKGLHLAATTGTAAALGRNYLAKTGTSASSTHSGDGWAAAAWPAQAPTKAALFRQPGVPGAQAARTLTGLLTRWPS